MGFFSWNCKACGHSILSFPATEEHNKWMSEAVVLTPDNEVYQGEYDGYGRVDDFDVSEWGNDPEIYHKACWHLIGEPTVFSGSSVPASDQGWFFEDNMRNIHEPKNKYDLEILKTIGTLMEKVDCQKWKIVFLESFLQESQKELGTENELSKKIADFFETNKSH